MDYKIKDIKLAPKGNLQLEWAAMHMPALEEVRKDFLRTKPFKGKRISALLHVTKETGMLMRCLKAGGAELALGAGNPLSTQDDIAAAINSNKFINPMLLILALAGPLHGMRIMSIIYTLSEQC